MLTAVSTLSPVSNHTLIPAALREWIVSGTPSWSRSSMAVTPSNSSSCSAFRVHSTSKFSRWCESNSASSCCALQAWIRLFDWRFYYFDWLPDSLLPSTPFGTNTMFSVRLWRSLTDVSAPWRASPRLVPTWWSLSREPAEWKRRPPSSIESLYFRSPAQPRTFSFCRHRMAKCGAPELSLIYWRYGWCFYLELHTRSSRSQIDDYFVESSPQQSHTILSGCFNQG